MSGGSKSGRADCGERNLGLLSKRYLKSRFKLQANHSSANRSNHRMTCPRELCSIYT